MGQDILVLGVFVVLLVGRKILVYELACVVALVGQKIFLPGLFEEQEILMYWWGRKF